MAIFSLTAIPHPQQASAAAQAARPAFARWSVAGWILLFWYGFYGLMLPSDIIEDMQMSHSANFARDVVDTVLQAGLWCIASPLILWVAQRCPIEGPGRWRNIGVHVASGLAVSAIIVAICHTVIYSVFGPRIGSHVHWSLGQSVLVSTPYLFIIYLAFSRSS